MLPAFDRPVALALLVVAASIGGRPADETQEPPARFQLVIGEETLSVEEGRDFSVELGGKTYDARLTGESTRQLAITGASFEYPSNMSFEFERSFFLDIWTLDGNDAVVMIFRIGDAPEFDDFIDEQLSSYEPLGDVSSEAIEIELDGKTIKGRIIVAESRDFTIVVEYYPIGPDGSASQVLALQDVRDDARRPSDEYSRVREGIVETFEFGSD